VRITLSEDLHTGTLVLLHHFNSENVVDFDVVGGDAVVQEVGREHHIVASIPELGLVLRVEEQDISGTNEVETRHDCHGGEAVDEETGVVQRTVRIVDETRECGSHHSVDLVDLNPVVVGDLECSAHRVRAHVTRSHLQKLEDGANEAASLGETLVDEVLETSRVPEEERLEPF
jgi:hypothetical protein